MPNRYALIVGNSEYSDNKLAKLRSPNSDVNALAEILRKTSLGNFDEVEVLLNTDSATVRKTITQFFSNKKRDDLLLLYFSGHGVLDDRGRLFLAVKDTEHHLLRGTSLPASFITDEMDNCNSNRQILILDCCHSGAFARGTKGVIGKSVGTSSAFMGNGYGRIVLTATDSTEYAWEGDDLLGAKQNSVFTHYLIQGIETGKADLDHDGLISIDELYDYARDSVSGSTSKQTPGKWSFKQQGELIISKSPFIDQFVSEIGATHPVENIKELEFIGPSLSTQILKSGLAGGLIATLLLLYPLYIYIPSLYVSEWHNGYGILAYPLMFLALIPIAWSGWLMARWTKTGWEAIFLGAQAGSVASSIAFIFLIAAAAGVSAFKPALQLMPGTILASEQLGGSLVSPLIATFRYIVYTWMAVEFAGLLLGSLGCLFHLQRSGQEIRFSSFNLTFDLYWWKMILGGVVSAVLVLSLSSAIFELLTDQVLETARQANYQITSADKNLIDWFPSVPPLIGLMSILILGSISTLGSVPKDPSHQRTIAFYAILAALLPWLNPLTWFYRYLMYGIYSTVHMLLAILCATAGMILILFAGRLLKQSGWGKLVNTTGKYFWVTQLFNAFLFVMLAAPAMFMGGFYLSTFIDSISILSGTSSISVSDLISKAFGMQIRLNLIAVMSVWILYVILGGLLKPFLWAHNGIAGLFPTWEQKSKPDVQQPLTDEAAASTETATQPAAVDGTTTVPPFINENMRYFKAAGFILGIPLLLVIAIRMFSHPTPGPVSPLQTPGFVLTLQAGTVSPTNTPVIARATITHTFIPNPATLTVAAAFTQLAASTQTVDIFSTSTPPPTSTRTATATPITTLTPTGALLRLDKNYVCREWPRVDSPEVTSLASGVRLPVLATNSKSGGWWLVIIKLSVSKEAVCWVENGTIEGDAKKIPVIDVSAP